MKNTTITLSNHQLGRIAMGHDGGLDPVPLWPIDGIVGAGSIRSTAQDMLKFAGAQLGLVNNPLKASMAAMLCISRPGAASSVQQHIGWAETKGGVLFHSGRRGGFSSVLALHPATRTAAVVLSNSVHSMDDIAFHALTPEFPLRSFAPARQEITLAEALLETYVGSYAFTPAVSIEITREGFQLMGQVTKQPKFKLYAEQEAKFFIKDVDA
jgi:CubicO group peptidase (beta-lactamase class C family)